MSGSGITLERLDHLVLTVRDPDGNLIEVSNYGD